MVPMIKAAEDQAMQRTTPVTCLFVEIAEGMGIGGILHTTCDATAAKLAAFGLEYDDGAAHETG